MYPDFYPEFKEYIRLCFVRRNCKQWAHTPYIELNKNVKRKRPICSRNELDGEVLCHRCIGSVAEGEPDASMVSHMNPVATHNRSV